VPTQPEEEGKQKPQKPRKSEAAFRLEKEVTLLRLHPEQSSLELIYSELLRRFLRRKKMPWFFWMRTKKAERVFLFNRAYFTNRIGDDTFREFLFTFQDGMGGASERGFMVYESERKILVACVMDGNVERPKILESKVCKVVEDEGHFGVVEVKATKRETDRVIRKLFF
jgi:hypothetical protein